MSKRPAPLAGLPPTPSLKGRGRGLGAILAPYGPPASQGDGRSVLRPYDLACTYSCRGGETGSRQRVISTVAAARILPLIGASGLRSRTRTAATGV